MMLGVAPCGCVATLVTISVKSVPSGVLYVGAETTPAAGTVTIPVLVTVVGGGWTAVGKASVTALVTSLIIVVGAKACVSVVVTGLILILVNVDSSTV